MIFLAIGAFAGAVFFNVLGVDFTTASAVMVTGFRVIALATTLAFMGMDTPWIMLLVLVGLWISLSPAFDVHAMALSGRQTTR